MYTAKFSLAVCVLALAERFQPSIQSNFVSDFDGSDMGALATFLYPLDALSNGVINQTQQLLNAALGQAGANATIYFKAALVDLASSANGQYPGIITLINNTENAIAAVLQEIMNAESKTPIPGILRLGNTAEVIGNAVKVLRNVHNDIENQQKTASPGAALFLTRMDVQRHTAFDILYTIIYGIYDLVAQEVLANIERQKTSLGRPPKYKRFDSYLNAAMTAYNLGGALYQSEDEVHFVFYPDHTDIANRIYLEIDDIAGLQASGYNKEYPLILIITGLVSNVDVRKILLSAYLNTTMLQNVIVVEWEHVSGDVIMPLLPDTYVDYIGAYVQMASNVKFTANVVSRFLQFLNDAQYLHKPDAGFVDAHFVCHSLGAHVAGLAAGYYEAANSETINRITAADPAGKLYQGYAEKDRFNSAQARYTQALITNAGGFGFQSNRTKIANADIYINHGRFQPSCITGTGDNKVYADLTDPCSHNTAAIYLALSTSMTFKTKCCEGTCDPKKVSIGEQIDLSAIGIYRATITLF